MRILISEDVNNLAPLNKAFYKWFGNSIVKNENGMPLIVHHGTPKGGFNTFTPSTQKKKSDNQLDFGTHFTTDKEHSKIYLTRQKRENSKPTKASQTYDCYLRIINPLDANKYYWREDNPEEFEKLLELTKKMFGSRFKKAYSHPDFFYDKNAQKQKEIQFLMWGYLLDHIPPSTLYNNLLQLGYDGVIYNPLMFGYKTVEKQKLAYIVLKSNQIKSIYNDGSFDLNDNNIYS